MHVNSRDRISRGPSWKLVLDRLSKQPRTKLSIGAAYGQSNFDVENRRSADPACGTCDPCWHFHTDRSIGSCRSEGDALRDPCRGGGAARCGRADHGDRVDQEPARHVLRRRRLDTPRTGFDRREGTRDSGGRLRHSREERRPPFQSLRRCLDAPHAAPHLERHRAARWPAAGLCRLAWLRADALWLCQVAVRQDANRDAGDHLAERRCSGRDFSRGVAPAERRGHRCCPVAC